ncbi:hypothetical protein BH09ACT3_BH09ACT3_12590 [soil metagenome]
MLRRNYGRATRAERRISCISEKSGDGAEGGGG